jgi:hypothetical protein
LGLFLLLLRSRRAAYNAHDLSIFNGDHAPKMVHTCPPVCGAAASDEVTRHPDAKVAEITIWEESKLWRFTDRLHTGTESTYGDLRLGGYAIGPWLPQSADSWCVGR